MQLQTANKQVSITLLRENQFTDRKKSFYEKLFRSNLNLSRMFSSAALIRLEKNESFNKCLQLFVWLLEGLKLRKKNLKKIPQLEERKSNLKIDPRFIFHNLGNFFVAKTFLNLNVLQRKSRKCSWKKSVET